MIDIHCHLLPNIDDGARDLAMAEAMAKMAVHDGIRVIACTPHIMPPRYPNRGDDIKRRVRSLQAHLNEQGIVLFLAVGGDVHISFDLVRRLELGVAPCLHSSRYFLFEPDHKILTPRIVELCQTVIRSGYRPILTHPERLTWVSGHFDVVQTLYNAGVIMQITAGSLTGRFGATAQMLCEKLFTAGMVDVIATDAHNITSRPPVLSEARDWVVANYGEPAAHLLTYANPLKILRNEAIDRVQTSKKRHSG